MEKTSEMIKRELEDLQAQHDAIMEKARAELVITGNYEHLITDYDFYKRKRDLEHQLMVAKYKEINVGDPITMVLYSDYEAGTCIKRTAKTLVFQRDKAIKKGDWKPEWVVGGFSAICTNQEDQEWEIERDPEGAKTTFYWSEKNGRWQAGGDTGCKIITGHHEFYDYNF